MLPALFNGADARTVTALDLKHGTFFEIQLAVLLSHAAIRNIGVLHLEMESKQSSASHAP